MVTSITNLKTSDLIDWMLECITAIVLLTYTLLTNSFLLLKSCLRFQQWGSLFENLAIRIFALMRVLSFAVPTWIGLWNIVIDGAPKAAIRILVQPVTGMVKIIGVAWALQVIWGI